MKATKQVHKDHYRFDRYMTKLRWISVWHQIDEVLRLEPETVLEIGPGSGLFKSAASLFGITVETLDLDPELQPDHVGSITDIPLKDSGYDVVCAFQVLEHLPYESSLKAMSEMARVSRRNVVISLPDARAVWRFQFYIPKLRSFDLLIPRPQFHAQDHQFDGEHYREISKNGYQLEKVSSDLNSIIDLKKTYRVKENPYHRFFIFAK